MGGVRGSIGKGRRVRKGPRPSALEGSAVGGLVGGSGGMDRKYFGESKNALFGISGKELWRA